MNSRDLWRSVEDAMIKEIPRMRVWGESQEGPQEMFRSPPEVGNCGKKLWLVGGDALVWTRWP